jgi:hypothetical protein
MNKQQENYRLLLEKLDRFIRKFYLNALIRGAMYFLGSILVLFLAFNFLEDQYYFNTGVRKAIFYGFIGFFILGFSYWIGAPILKFFRLGKTISHEQAATIIGTHFGNIEDKLLNILHLHKQVQDSEAKELIIAGIEQKSEKINPVPFRNAIDLSKNRKHLKYALPPLLIFLLVLFAAPSLIKDSTNRIIQNDKEFVKEAPFSFIVKNEKLEVVQYQDMNLQVEVEGDKIPDEVFIRINQYQYRLKKESPSNFSYVFKNVFEDTKFELFSGKIKSIEHDLKVLPKPTLVQLEVNLQFPAYTGRKQESIRNNGDLVVPVGTRASWKLDAKHTNSLQYIFEDDAVKTDASLVDEGRFSFQRTLKKDGQYKIYINNARISSPDSISYAINIIPDKYPEIEVDEFIDSLENQNVYFAGSASDDYGLSSLLFNYSIIDAEGNTRAKEAIAIAFKNNASNSVFYDYNINIDSFYVAPGEAMNYYFEVFDNDAVNGIKSSRTGLMQYKKPTKEEFEKKEEKNDEEIKKDLESSMEKIKKLQKNIKKSRDKVLQKKELEWQDKKELEKILEQQKELEKLLEEAKKKFDENMKNQDQIKQQDENLLQKQEQLQKMFEEVLSDETKELMQKIEDLMQELQKDDMLEMMEDFEMDNETMEKELDRLMELFKQLELEKEVSDQIDKLKKLAEKQEKLSEETKEESKENEKLKEEQKKINKEFEKLEEKMEEIMEKNEELEHPKDLAKDNEEKMEEISEDLDKSEESLDKKDSDKASESQNSAAQKMKSMANSLEVQMTDGQAEQQTEDLRALRQLLENLLTLSFEQEELIDDIAETDPLTPRYKELVSKQFDLKLDFQMIDDSLQALSKRVIEIESFVTEKVTEVKKEMGKALENLEGLETNNNVLNLREQDISEANKNQRSTMKNINDLALMLDESMQQMQQNMANGVPGSGSCNKPGGNGKPTSGGDKPGDKMGKGQESLNEMLKGMKEKMKGEGSGGMAKEFAQAAARQAAMRKALEQMKKEVQGEGKGGGNELQKIIDEMNKTEIDLVNKRLDNELIQRQQEILSKLLEAENADKQRKFDNKRKSKTADQLSQNIPPALEKYLKKRESELDLYKTVSPSLNPFYKNLVDEYYKALKKAN